MEKKVCVFDQQDKTLPLTDIFDLFSTSRLLKATLGGFVACEGENEVAGNMHCDFVSDISRLLLSFFLFSSSGMYSPTIVKNVLSLVQSSLLFYN